MQPLEKAHITAVPGFRAAGVHCGLKPPGDLDLALIYSEAPCRAAAVFTRNRVKAAPVLYDQEVLAGNCKTIQAMVINSGYANACTGQRGLDDALATARLVGDELALNTDQVLVMSTGVIGQHLPMDKIEAGVKAAAAALSDKGGHEAALAIMTTDTRPKEAAVEVEIGGRTVTIAGMCKGAGMIHPDMATMLALAVTDAAINADCLRQALVEAADLSFNMMTVDGDTSTNDTFALLANRLAGNPEITDPDSDDYRAFAQALTQVAQQLAQAIARDGEGATKFVTITVKSAPGFGEAKQVALAIAHSPLVKTALYGQDANWGRVLSAVGYSGVAVQPERLALWFGSPEDNGPPLQLVKDGRPYDVDEARAAAILAHHDVDITVDLGLGGAEATVWTCDLSHDYVSINAHYRT
jgi:glutamate N-acetyltransferase/amino-acid N-acetyltransferase